MINDSDLIKQDIIEWMKGSVFKSNETCSGMTLCPFAEKIYQQKRLKIVTSIESGKTYQDYALTFDKSKYDIIIFADIHYPQTPQELHDDIDLFNNVNFKNDIYLMAFHPDETDEAAELFGDFFGSDIEVPDYSMVFIQKLLKLDDAAKNLEDTAYYDNWKLKEYKKLVIERRRLAERLRSLN